MASRCQNLFPPHPFIKGKALGTRLKNVLNCIHAYVHHFYPLEFFIIFELKNTRIFQRANATSTGINCEYTKRSNFLFERAGVLILEKKNLAFRELMHLSGDIKENFEEPESEANKGK